MNIDKWIIAYAFRFYCIIMSKWLCWNRNRIHSAPLISKSTLFMQMQWAYAQYAVKSVDAPFTRVSHLIYVCPPILLLSNSFLGNDEEIIVTLEIGILFIANGAFHAHNLRLIINATNQSIESHSESDDLIHDWFKTIDTWIVSMHKCVARSLQLNLMISINIAVNFGTWDLLIDEICRHHQYTEYIYQNVHLKWFHADSWVVCLMWHQVICMVSESRSLITTKHAPMLYFVHRLPLLCRVKFKTKTVVELSSNLFVRLVGRSVVRLFVCWNGSDKKHLKHVRI